MRFDKNESFFLNSFLCPFDPHHQCPEVKRQYSLSNFCQFYGELKPTTGAFGVNRVAAIQCLFLLCDLPEGRRFVPGNFTKCLELGQFRFLFFSTTFIDLFL